MSLLGIMETESPEKQNKNDQINKISPITLELFIDFFLKLYNVYKLFTHVGKSNRGLTNLQFTCLSRYIITGRHREQLMLIVYSIYTDSIYLNLPFLLSSTSGEMDES